jgi:hypothetical protein
MILERWGARCGSVFSGVMAARVLGVADRHRTDTVRRAIRFAVRRLPQRHAAGARLGNTADAGFLAVPLAAACFRDIPTPRQSLGMAVAFCGLLVIVATIGGDLTLTALAFAIAAGLSWAIGNVLVRFAGHVATVALMAWASLVVPLPALTLSWMLDANSNLATTIVAAPWLAIGARSTSERCQPILLTRLGVGC